MSGPTPHLRLVEPAPAVASGELDIVDTWPQARQLPASPLIVREGVREVLGLADLPFVERIDAGHSNPTFMVVAGERRLILRRPPRPPYAAGAHDVLREYRILKALRSLPVRAPAAVAARADNRTIGAPFYLMEVIDGVVVRGAVPPPLDTPGERRRIAEELVDALVELHAVDPRDAGLGDASRGGEYLARQVALWSRQWEENQTRRVPELDEVTRRLRHSLPASPQITIVHGDYKLDNVLFALDAPARLVAILDWEMATLGDPLADLGYLSATWLDQGEDPDQVVGLSSATAEVGFPGRRQLAERYAAASGLGLENLAWYQTLALWKLAVLLEGSYRRYLAGSSPDAFFATLSTGVPRIAQRALAASEGALL